MPLTPYDIHNKEFNKSFRGYDVDEVNDFLDQIIKDFELLTREKLEIEQQVEDLQTELERLMGGESMFQTSPQLSQNSQRLGSYQQTEPLSALQPAQISSMEHSIHKSIRMAQDVAEEVRINAKKEAELVVQEAEKNSDRIVNDALNKAREINGEFLELKQKATVYKTRLRTLIQSHLEVLDNSDWDSLKELNTEFDETDHQLEKLNESAEEITNEAQIEVMEEEQALEEAAAHYSNDEEEQPQREMRRNSRKIKRKAMY